MKNETKFSTRDIAEFKRTARNVWPLQAKKEKLQAKLTELQAEMELIDRQIALKEAYVFETTGYHVFDLVERKVVTTPAANEDGTPKLNDAGEQILTVTTDYVLKFPETVIPTVVVEQTTDESIINEDVNKAEIDGNAIVEETETSAAEAPFNPIAGL